MMPEDSTRSGRQRVCTCWLPPPMKPWPVGSWPPPMTLPDRSAATKSGSFRGWPSGRVHGDPHELGFQPPAHPGRSQLRLARPALHRPPTTPTRETRMSGTTENLAGATAIRPFRIEVPEEDLVDLRRRIEATRWPSGELVDNRSQGVQLATMKELARYWTTEYDWRKCEARLNALPQFTTEIDGVDIHFIHVKSPHEDALPLIMTHGWPGSVVELLETVGPLTDPTAHGGDAEDAFHLVLPSMPGYGFSGEPRELGWDSGRVAQAWAELMRRLGYTRYVAQGGDVGAAVTDAMARQAPEGLLGVHINVLTAVVVPGIVDNVTLYWLTGTGASAARNYWEDGRARARFAVAPPPPASVPVGFTTFPDEVWAAPRGWVEVAYPDLAYFNEVDKGGHFAAWEEPELFSTEVRAAFSSLRLL